MNRIQYVVLHHTGIHTSLLSEEDHYKSLQNVTKRQYGTRFILPYHTVIGFSGIVFEGQPYGQVCPHCGIDQGEGEINNWNALGISCMGNFEKETMQNAQYHSLVEVLRSIYNQYFKHLSIAEFTQTCIVKHKMLVPTDCPGQHFPFSRVLNELCEQPASGGTPGKKKDFETRKPWFQEAVDFCLGNGIMSGDEHGFRPYEAVTRAEMASVLYRLLRGDNQNEKAN